MFVFNMFNFFWYFQAVCEFAAYCIFRWAKPNKDVPEKEGTTAVGLNNTGYQCQE